MSAPESARSRDRRTGANPFEAAPRMSVDARHAAVASLPDATTDADPLFTVTRGNPSPEELAALVAVLGALPEPQDAPPAHARRAPRHQSRRLRLGLRLRPGRGAWRWTQPER